jgi:hypothetical protein
MAEEGRRWNPNGSSVTGSPEAMLDCSRQRQHVLSKFEYGRSSSGQLAALHPRSRQAETRKVGWLRARSLEMPFF